MELTQREAMAAKIFIEMLRSGEHVHLKDLMQRTADIQKAVDLLTEKAWAITDAYLAARPKPVKDAEFQNALRAPRQK